MDIIGNLAHGFGVVLSFTNLMFALIGALIGTAIGALPGIGPVAATAVLPRDQLDGDHVSLRKSKEVALTG